MKNTLGVIFSDCRLLKFVKSILKRKNSTFSLKYFSSLHHLFIRNDFFLVQFLITVTTFTTRTTVNTVTVTTVATVATVTTVTIITIVIVKYEMLHVCISMK